jgi:hypothetical protein
MGTLRLKRGDILPTNDEKRRDEYNKYKDEIAEEGYPVTVDKKHDGMDKPVKGLPKAK